MAICIRNLSVLKGILVHMYFQYGVYYVLWSRVLYFQVIVTWTLYLSYINYKTFIVLFILQGSNVDWEQFLT